MWIFLQALGFLIVFGSVLFIAYVTTKYVGAKANKTMQGKYISVVESISLGMDKQIHLLKVADEFVLVSSSGKNIEFLTAVHIDGYENGDENAGMEPFDFKIFFDKYLKALQNKKDQFLMDRENLSRPACDAQENVFRKNLDRLRSIASNKGNNSSQVEESAVKVEMDDC